MSIQINRSSYKDRILENVAKAIKGIQEVQIYHTSDDAVTLTSHDRPARKLLEHLDHVLLHGLRHITDGYWKIVSEFTNKTLVRELKRLTNIATDLGRGRSWLCLALNEGLMESYFRCFEGNIKLVKKHYVKEALVLDQQRLNVLITLITGIELVVFQLDYDVPYLDLSTAPPQSRSRADSEETESDRLSLCSMDSVASNASRNIARESPVTVEGEKSHSLLVNGFLDQIDENSETRFDRLDSVITDDVEPEDTSIEVIHVKRGSTKNKKPKGKKHKKEPTEDQPSEVTNEVKRPNELNLIKNEPKEQEEQYKKIDNLDKDTKPFYKLTTDVKEDDLVTPDVTKKSRPGSTASNCSVAHMKHVHELEKDFVYDKSLDVSENYGSDDSDNFIEDEYIPGCIIPGQEDNELDNAFAEKVLKEFENKHNVSLSGGSVGSNLDIDHSSFSENANRDLNHENNTHTSAIGEQSKNHNGSTLHGTSVSLIEERDYSKKNHSSDMTGKGDKVQSTRTENEPSVNEKSSTSQMADLVDNMINQSDVVLKHHLYEEEPEDVKLDDSVNKSRACEGELKLDNNTLLYLMLDVFDNSEEQFIRIFATTQGHTDGESTPVFVTITDRSIYFLSQKQSDHRFHKDVSIPFSSIDFIALGMNEQTIHIQCTNKRNQYWITTGNQILTRGIIDCVISACKENGLPPVSVDTHATTQKFSLSKYIKKECNSEDGTICCYSLVHWDTPSPQNSNSEKLHREGHLLYKMIEPQASFIGSQILQNSVAIIQNPSSLIYGQPWKPAYVVLKDGLLCIYNDKNDSKPILFVQVGGEECKGCRRATDTDKDHSIQIIKSDGSSVQLALATGLEASDWLQSLCQAVAEGLDTRDTKKMGCMACCLVLSPQKLLMCHEDLQSNFIRTLGSANVIDVSAVLDDSHVKTFCVLMFESHEINISSEQWVLHFNSEPEKTRFIQALSESWKTHFEVEVPVIPIEDFSLTKICREMAITLKDKLTVRKS